VTVRDRDTRGQERVKVGALGEILRGKTRYPPVFR
jgi:glycyl-tRNA synthetase (class II)